MSQYESDSEAVETYCDEYVSDNNATAEFSLANFNEWLASQDEPEFEGTEEEFLALVEEVGFDIDTKNWA